jgi:hypothetical protein
MDYSSFFFIINQVALFDHFFDSADTQMIWNIGIGRKFQNDQVSLFAAIDAANLICAAEGGGAIYVKALMASSVEMFI